MGIPVWITTNTNLGTVQHYAAFEKIIVASEAEDYSIIDGSLPTGITLDPVTGVLAGVPIIDEPLSNTPIFVYTFTVAATSNSSDVSTKIFRLSVLYYDVFVPDRIDQARVRFSNNYFQYQINHGTVNTSINQYWRLKFGQLPPGVILYQNGTIEGTADFTTVPMSRETFLNQTAPVNDNTSQAAWDEWFKNYIAGQPRDQDYQFVIELSNGTGVVQLSVTVRLLYLKVPTASSWFQTNQAYITYDPDAYYVFFAVSDSDYITWDTDFNLERIKNGAISELSVEAHSYTGKQVRYAIKPLYSSRLPQGIIFLDNGLLVGRISFRCYQDDPVTLPENDDYGFTVRATTKDGFTYSEKTFNLHVERFHEQPYNNLWIRSFATADERRRLQKILTSTVLFPNRLIYRYNDPWFGQSTDLRFLFVPGLKNKTTEEYYAAMANNHYIKTLSLGQVKTAVAYDINLNIRYEVVYIPVIDNLSKIDSKSHVPVGPPDVIDLRTQIKNYYWKNNQTYYIFKPNGLLNMRNQLAQQIEFYYQGILPTWMTSVQPIPQKLGQFYSPLGFVPAIVLAYCQPGGSEVIAFRIRQAAINFNDFKFEFDRYELDENLSKTYDPATSTFDQSNSTTFDGDTTLFENHTTRFNENLDYGGGISGSGPLVGNKYLKFPHSGAFT
jgi:hypothetical protein